MNQLRHLWRAASGWVWPRTCFLCSAKVSEGSPVCLCSGCWETLAADAPPACPRCSGTIGPHVDATSGCPNCRTSSFRFAAATRLGVYDGPLRDAVLKCKQPGADGLAESLGRLFAESRKVELQATGAKVIVPVPLHWRRWWTRRHNQAEGIARGLSAGLGLPVLRRALWRVKPVPPQAGGSRAERWANADGAFRVAPWAWLSGLTVLLVDDVLTTGATADAAAAALRAGGAAQVHAAVLAHR